MSATVRNGIGGSTVAAIAGKNPYATPFDAYAEIVTALDGKAQPEGRETEASVVRKEAGKLLEQYLFERFCARERVDPRTFIRNPEMQDAQHPFLRGEPDAVGRDRIVEIKTVWSWRQFERWGEAGSDDIPEEYLCQVAWYCWLAKKPRASIVVLIDGNIRQYEYQHTPELVDALRDKAVTFWNAHIIPRIPPPNFRADASSIASVYPLDNGAMREATVQEADVISRWLTVKSEQSALADQREHFEAQIKQAVGDMTGLRMNAGTLTWKAGKPRQEVDWEAVARESNATADLIAKHTKIKPGVRRMNFSHAKGV